MCPDMLYKQRGRIIPVFEQPTFRPLVFTPEVGLEIFGVVISTAHRHPGKARLASRVTRAERAQYTLSNNEALQSIDHQARGSASLVVVSIKRRPGHRARARIMKRLKR